MTTSRGVAVAVEADDGARAQLKELLTQAGFDVVAVADGFAGVEAVRQNAPLVTTVDLAAGGIDGIEVVKRIRSFSPTFIVMVTHSDDEVDLVQALNAGADAYIARPFGLREFRARLEAILRRADASFLESAAQAAAARAESLDAAQLDAPSQAPSGTDQRLADGRLDDPHATGRGHRPLAPRRSSTLRRTRPRQHPAAAPDVWTAPERARTQPAAVNEPEPVAPPVEPPLDSMMVPVPVPYEVPPPVDPVVEPVRYDVRPVEPSAQAPFQPSFQPPVAPAPVSYEPPPVVAPPVDPVVEAGRYEAPPAVESPVEPLVEPLVESGPTLPAEPEPDAAAVQPEPLPEPVALVAAAPAPTSAPPLVDEVAEQVPQPTSQPTSQPAPAAAGRPEEWEHFQGLSVSRAQRQVQVDGVPVELSHTEFDLLASMLTSGRRIRSRAELAILIGGGDRGAHLDDTARRRADAVMGSLLAKLGENADAARWIEAVPGVGYRRTAR
ncbi:response regulator [Nocardioides sp. zg-536]|uniref:Response regulator n=1 Tax=Nocardioides faecalis TaxID=2803858 RepID=A0A939BU95_9ACTN|nr:response regulator [Nocardioides faecalis]MBM9461439.1 response regulator [Nocardioides faecalis]QVI59372.1 response regulator [Nocardioides faecalis]